MLSQLLITELALKNVRNIGTLKISPERHLNVISGNNGHGKTSILEAIYLACTTKSFRTDRPKELIQTGAEQCSVTLSILETDLPRQQRAVITPSTRSFFVDGKRIRRFADFALHTPLVVFEPGDLDLVSGSAQGRRNLLDRVSFFVDPMSHDSRQRYQKAQRERQRVLQQRGVRAPELPAYEQLMAENGALLEAARQSAAQRIEAELSAVFRTIADPRIELVCKFMAGAPLGADEFGAQLRASRELDQRRKSAAIGPHRDELELSIDGRSARRHASQGQQRVLALSLKLAEVQALREARQANPVILLDDVSSELDATRTHAVLEFLSETANQILVTTTRPELFSSFPKRADFRLFEGALRSS